MNRSTPAVAVLARAAALLVLVVAVSAATWVLTRPHLAWLADEARAPEALTGAGLPRLVTSGCAVTLAGCWGWVALALLATAGRVLAGGPRSAPRWAPAVVRVVVATVLGIGAAPLTAHAHQEAPGPPTATADAAATTGLLLPDRARTTPVPVTAHPRPAPHVVSRGESLWSITAGLLPAGTPDAVVDAGWRRLAALNRARLGDDPGLIRPGLVLRVPPRAVLLGKEHP